MSVSCLLMLAATRESRSVLRSELVWVIHLIDNNPGRFGAKNSNDRDRLASSAPIIHHLRVRRDELTTVNTATTACPSGAIGKATERNSSGVAINSSN
jgi:hypothetical protein